MNGKKVDFIDESKFSSKIVSLCNSKIRDFIGLSHYMGMGLYGGPLSGLLLYIWLWYRRHYYVAVAYTIWYLLDLRTPERGGRPWKSLRSFFPYRFISEYLPIKLIKTEDLTTDRNYLLICHPHGLLVFGAVNNFATDVTGFNKLFPGLKSVLATLKPLFYFPFFRDYLLACNCTAVCKDSLEFCLTKQGTGNAVAVVVGGTRELLEARPGSTGIVIKSRKGFVKIALKTGSDLVPVYTFGENDLFNQVHHLPGFGWLKSTWQAMVSTVGFPLLLPTSLLPRRCPLFTVVGRPVKVQKCENPSIEQIDNLHQEYINALEKLFEDNKLKFGMKADDHLQFI